MRRQILEMGAAIALNDNKTGKEKLQPEKVNTIRHVVIKAGASEYADLSMYKCLMESLQSSIDYGSKRGLDTNADEAELNQIRIKYRKCVQAKLDSLS